MRNDFTENTRALFIWNYSCFECGRSKPLTLHHIFRRISKSPLNAAPLCQSCHEVGDIHSDKKRVKYLLKTISFLWKQNYKLNKSDKEFLAEIIKKFDIK